MEDFKSFYEGRSAKIKMITNQIKYFEEQLRGLKSRAPTKYLTVKDISTTISQINDLPKSLTSQLNLLKAQVDEENLRELNESFGEGKFLGGYEGFDYPLNKES